VRIVSTDPDQPGFFAIGQVAVGVIAVGQLALGVIAIGQLARGVICIGQGAVGVIAIGQGAVGLWYGTGILALAGQRGYGLALHTLPQIVRDPLPDLAPPTPLRDLVEGRVGSGWIPAKLDARGLIEPDEGPAPLDASNVYSALLDAQRRGLDRLHVKVRASVVPEASEYRAARSHVLLVAEQIVAYSSDRPAYLAYGVPPKGAPGGRASAASIVVRTIVWLIALVVVFFVSFVPLAEALFP
jgi:hypothetical protein